MTAAPSLMENILMNYNKPAALRIAILSPYSSFTLLSMSTPSKYASFTIFLAAWLAPLPPSMTSCISFSRADRLVLNPVHDIPESI